MRSWLVVRYLVTEVERRAEDWGLLSVRSGAQAVSPEEGVCVLGAMFGTFGIGEVEPRENGEVDSRHKCSSEPSAAKRKSWRPSRHVLNLPGAFKDRNYNWVIEDGWGS